MTNDTDHRTSAARELDAIAEAIASSDGEHFNEWTAPRYRSLARASLVSTLSHLESRLSAVPHGGRYTRASWTVAVLSDVATVAVDEVDPA